MRLRQIILFSLAVGMTAPMFDAAAQSGGRNSNAFGRRVFETRPEPNVVRKPLARSLAEKIKINPGRKLPGRWKDVVDSRPKVPPKDEPMRPDRRPKPDSSSDSADTKPDKRPGRRPPVIVLPVPPPVVRAPVLAVPLAPPQRSLPDRIVPPQRPSETTPPAPGTPSPPVLATAPEFLPDEVLITVATAALPQLEADVAQAFNVTVLERIALPLIDARLVRLRIPDGRTVPAVVAALTADPRVLLAQANFIYRVNNEPTAVVAPAAAASAAGPAGLQYSLVKLAAAEVHLLTVGRGTTVAVIDSGVDDTHPDFAGVRIAHFNATGDSVRSSSEFDTHGTGVAGIIAARGTVKGLAPAADLASARVFRRGATGSIATTEAVLKAITWSAEIDARVLNMSFAGPRDPLVERHIKVTTARGMITIAAAGNNGARAAPAYPAAYDDVVAVTAVDARDRLYDKANRGRHIAVAAPGVDVIVPAIGRAYHFQSGTSMAAAHVSAIAALLLEVDPSLTPQGLRQVLMDSSEDLGDSGHDDAFGAGRVNAMRAIRLLAESRATVRR